LGACSRPSIRPYHRRGKKKRKEVAANDHPLSLPFLTGSGAKEGKTAPPRRYCAAGAERKKGEKRGGKRGR